MLIALAVSLGSPGTGAALMARPPLAISPDGAWLAFTGPGYRLGLHSLTAGSVRMLPIGDVSGLRWSADSRRLAAVGHGGRQVWEVDVAEGEAALALPPDGQWVGFPEYLPDGDLVLVVVGGDGQFRLGRFRRLTATWQTLFEATSPLAGPRASPDGRKLAFLMGTPGASELWLLDLGTGAAQRVVPAPAENPVWSPNSATLAFERPDPAGGTRQVATVDPETGSVHPLGPGGFPHWVGDRLFWVTSDGEILARSPMAPAARLAKTGVSGVQFATWADAGVLVLYHPSGLSLFDLTRRKLVGIGGLGPSLWVGAAGPGILQGPFGIPSTGYVTDLFRPSHPGLDIAKPLGLPDNQAPIVAAYPGRVVWAGDAWSGPYGGYGNLIVVDHGMVEGVQVSTYYAHWRVSYVRVGELVGMGRRLADQSDYGWATGVHLHFEVREGGTLGAWRPYFDGTPVDPTGPRYLNRTLKVGDFVVASNLSWAYRVLIPVVRR